MTSTNFNIGFEAEKNSSRVLRPPGGGHSDIFGIKNEDTATPSKRNNQPQSSIAGCFKMVEDQNDHGTKNVVKQTNGSDENTAPDEKKQVEKDVPKRTRVPPGGHSSGLW